MRLIDADELEERMATVYTDTDLRVHYCEIMRAIREQPTADAVPRRFGWWHEERDRERHWHCSQCGTVQGMACLAMKYCPECGAEMYYREQTEKIRKTGVAG